MPYSASNILSDFHVNSLAICLEKVAERRIQTVLFLQYAIPGTLCSLPGFITPFSAEMRLRVKLRRSR